MRKILIVLVLILGLGLPVSMTQAAVSDNEQAFRVLALELIIQLQKQIVILQSQLEKQREVEAGTGVGEYTDSVEVLADYYVPFGQGSLGIVDVEHRAYFDRVVELFPLAYRDRLERFVVFADSEKNIDAYVETIPPKHDKWLYGVNEDVIDDVDSNFNTELIIHEFGHVLSYDEMLGVPLTSEANCDRYFSKKGCPLENSYISDFVEDFWTTEDLARATEFSERSDSFKQAYRYYQNHKSEYVTDYAALSPEEDFSETFTNFVLLSKPTGNLIKNQKVNFFYQYPDLLKLRSEIRSSR